MSKEPWYPVPFKVGVQYEAAQDILGHFDRITKGERLTYKRTGFSSYDGYIGFFFTDAHGADRRWDIFDDLDSVSEAAKLFVKL